MQNCLNTHIVILTVFKLENLDKILPDSNFLEKTSDFQIIISPSLMCSAGI